MLSQPSRPFPQKKSDFFWREGAAVHRLSLPCSATFEQLLALRLEHHFAALATSSKVFFPFLSNFWAKCRLRAHIKHKVINDFIENLNVCEFLWCHQRFEVWTHNLSIDNVRREVKWTMRYVPYRNRERIIKLFNIYLLVVQNFI